MRDTRAPNISLLGKWPGKASVEITMKTMGGGFGYDAWRIRRRIDSTVEGSQTNFTFTNKSNCCDNLVKMRRAGDSLNVDLAAAVNNLFNLPETVENFLFPSSRAHDHHETRGVSSITPVDILDTPNEYIFFMDVPGVSKSEIQVTVEDENTLVIQSGGKRKRQEGEDEGCKYLRLERRGPQNLRRKFRLPENADVSAITAKCENGVLTVVVGKHSPPKSKTVQVAIA
ncbi:hypothetical protein VNO78_24947 [Psophocarpus tetragonolobus]|uniref:SHSP domain-containing protein n=1 Tax=Psophocarpus tetragonolobus TaxID=3891 RepID=A0AAN9S6G1_PSOTE